MIFNSTSSRISQSAQENQIIDPRLNVHEAEGSHAIDTILKVAVVAFAVFLTVTAFAVAGPLIGVVAILVIGLPLLLIFNGACCKDSHNHVNGSPPWYQRMFTWVPHVPVGG